MKKQTKSTHGGPNRNQGRKTRKELGLEPTVTITTSVEQSVADACKEKHGSIANALRYAAEKTPGAAHPGRAN